MNKFSINKILNRNLNNRIRTILFGVLLFLLLLGSFSLGWLDRTYGNISFEEIIFTINMPMQGAASEFTVSYVKEALIPALGVWLLLLFLIYYRFRYGISFKIDILHNRFGLQLLPLKIPGYLFTCIVIVWIGMICNKADTSFKMYEYVANQLEKSTFIEEEYVDPASVKLTFPEKKRNLIHIYLESMETTLMDVEHGGMFSQNYIPELTQLAQENISFSHSDQLEGCVVGPSGGWTMAGLVAQTCGIPLKIDDVNAHNSMGQYERFLPGAYSIGEILEAEGYHNYMLAGSDFDFGGGTSLLQKHGNYTIWDYDYAKSIGFLPEDYHENWGMEDAKLFELTKMKLLELAEQGEPFNVSLMTIDTHSPIGYVCDLCESKYSLQYANVYACASKQVWDFVDWVQQQDFYENVTICISGDHCSMNNGFFGNDPGEGISEKTRRKIYNAFVHPAVDTSYEKNRQFLTLDLYPTILASLGVEIEGERLGLGTNLFSGKKTLSEEYGYDKIFYELSKKSTFYNKNLLY